MKELFPFLKPKKQRGLYYLLPGMARSNRQRHRQVLRWTIIFGIIFSALFGSLIYFLNTRGL